MEVVLLSQLSHTTVLKQHTTQTDNISVHKAAELSRATASREATTTAEGEARYFFSSTADTDPVHKTRQKTH